MSTQWLSKAVRSPTAFTEKRRCCPSASSAKKCRRSNELQRSLRRAVPANFSSCYAKDMQAGISYTAHVMWYHKGVMDPPVWGF